MPKTNFKLSIRTFDYSDNFKYNYGIISKGGVSMEKVIYDKKNALWYELQGDYYIPCLKLPEEEQQPIGIWGQRHLRYIKQNRKMLYLNLLTSGKLNGYLSDLDKQAEDMFSRLVKQMAEREGVTEKLKAENQMEWVGRMNNIRSRAKEFINNELIFS